MQNNKQKSSKKRVNFNFSKSSIVSFFNNLKSGFTNTETFKHVLASLSLIPLAVFLWLAVPTFKIETSDKIYNFGPVQLFEQIDETSGESQIINRIGFSESFDLQSGATFNFEVVRENALPQEVEGQEVDETLENAETEVEQTTVIPSQDQLDKTISILRKRLDNLSLPETTFYSYKTDSSEGAIINLSTDRESAGIIPYYLSLKGENIEIWVDDPNYQPSEDQQSFSILDGLISSGLKKEDIAFVQVVNDQKTSGNGIKLVFKDESYNKFVAAAGNITNRGFVLLVDGQPISYQSYPLTATANNSAFVYMSNPFGAVEKETYEAIASVVNNEPLPLSLTVLSNSNSSQYIIVNTDRMKIALLVSFIIMLIIPVAIFKYKGIFVSLMTANVLVLSLGFLKLFNYSLNLNLIWGVIIGLSVSYILGITVLRELNSGKHTTEDSIKEVLGDIRINFRNISVLILIVMSIIELFSISFTYQLQIGIGIAMAATLLTIWTVYKAFSVEFFILPLKQNGKKK